MPFETLVAVFGRWCCARNKVDTKNGRLSTAMRRARAPAMNAIRAFVNAYLLNAWSSFFESNDAQADGRGGRGYWDGSQGVGYAIVHRYGRSVRRYKKEGLVVFLFC